MLGIMGILLYNQAPAFIEDLPIDNTEWPNKGDGKDPAYIAGKYEQAAINCFVASGFYLVTLVVSGVALRINSQSSYVTH